MPDPDAESRTPHAGERVVERGWVAGDVAAEFPELGLRWLEAGVAAGRSPAWLRERLGELADRLRGAQAVALRTQPVPRAYRTFFRQIGLDPDRDRTPIEAAAVERLTRGGFRSHGPLEDALLVALLQTGVPVWALDAARVDGPLGVRTAAGGRLVVADAGTAPLAVLFGEVGPACAVGRGSARLILFALRVAGVPEIGVQAALWAAHDVLADAAAPR